MKFILIGKHVEAMHRAVSAVARLCLLALSLVTTLPGLAVAADTTPPALTSFTFIPGTVDVSSGARVLVQLHATDDSSGVAYADVLFTSPSGLQALGVYASMVSGTPTDAQLEGTLYLDNASASEVGNWTVAEIWLADNNGNWQSLDTAALSSLGYPTILAVTSDPPSGLSDTTPPVLTSFSFSPTSVDVTSGDATVTVNLHVTDDLSGVSSAYAAFYSPSMGQYQYVYTDKIWGSSRDAELKGTLTLPQFSEAGDWIVYSIGLYDNANNSQWIDNATLTSLGYPTLLTVTSSGQDVTPPQLSSLSFSPTAIDVSSGTQSITFTLDITDSPAGVAFCKPNCYYTIALESPSGKQTQYEADWNVTRQSGTDQAGIWQVPVNLPRYAEPGVWKISYIVLHDHVGNVAWLDKAILQARGFPTTFSVVSSPSDTQPPQLTNLDFNPKFVDTTTGYKPITLTMSAVDNLAGVDVNYHSISPNLSSPHYLQFNSPSGGQSVWIYLQTLVGGTALNGTWQGSTGLPQFSEAGTWNLVYAYLSDAAGNRVSYDQAQLQAMGLPTSLEVILPSLAVDGYITDPATDTTIKDDVFGDRAQLIIPAGVLSGAAQVSLDVLSADLHMPVPTGFSTNGTNFVNIKLDPEPTPPFPAPGLTIVLPLLSQMNPGDPLTLYRIDPVSGNLTPEPSINGGLVVGTVNPDGLSATFQGVGSLSTVVGLIATGAVLGDLDGDGKVNCADIAIVRKSFGKRLNQPGFDARADTNHDNVVDVRDLAFVSRKLTAGVVCRITPSGAIQVSPP